MDLPIRKFKIPLSLINLHFVNESGAPLNLLQDFTYDNWNDINSEVDFNNVKTCNHWYADIEYIPKYYICKIELPILDYDYADVACATVHCYDDTDGVFETNKFVCELMNEQVVRADYSKWEWCEIKEDKENKSEDEPNE